MEALGRLLGLMESMVGGQASGLKEIALQIESWRAKQRQGGLLLGYCIK